MGKVLFIVPHEDDELFVGGSLLINLARDKAYDVKMFITTNGDCYPYEHKYRIEESINVLKRIGIERKDIIFGGYGDCWKGNHIYNSENNEVKESFGGHSATYMNGEQKEWHFERFNSHQEYTRNGYLNDIKSVIENFFPEVIICVDMDTHRDHRCLSLLTDEAMSDILKENPTYRPMLLKKFAYQGVLFGKSDFFEYPHKRTVNDSNDMWNPFLKWSDRVAYRVPSECDTMFLHTNYLFKLVKMYRTQNMWTYAPSFINKDIVYWMRNTNNVVLNSEVRVTSGERKYLNDFKLIDSSDIQEHNVNYAELCWRPDRDDNIREIRVEFQKSVSISTIILYFNCPNGLEGNYRLVYEYANGQQETILRTINTREDFFIDRIDISNIEIISFKIMMQEINGNLGIGEIEAIPNVLEIPFKEYLYKDSNKTKKFNGLIRATLLLEKILFKIEKVIYYHTDGWIKKRKEYDRRNS